jgi:mRNA interferase RelE/StbE
MIIEFDKSFEKSIDKIKDKNLSLKLIDLITKIENINEFREIPNTKKLVGFSRFYRIKIGDYRLGFEKVNEKTIRFLILEHRKDIYKKFP